MKLMTLTETLRDIPQSLSAILSRADQFFKVPRLIKSLVALVIKPYKSTLRRAILSELSMKPGTITKINAKQRIAD